MQTTQERYEEFVIRDQEESTVQPPDLLQGWRSPRQEPLRVRLGRALVALGKQLERRLPIVGAPLASSSECSLR